MDEQSDLRAMVSGLGEMGRDLAAIGRQMDEQVLGITQAMAKLGTDLESNYGPGVSEFNQRAQEMVAPIEELIKQQEEMEQLYNALFGDYDEEKRLNKFF